MFGCSVGCVFLGVHGVLVLEISLSLCGMCLASVHVQIDLWVALSFFEWVYLRQVCLFGA